MVTGWVFALTATVLNSVAGLLESDATRHVSRGRWLVTQPRYLGGLVVDGLGWATTVVALRYLPVFVVQAVLGGAIALVVALVGAWRADAAWPLALVAGLGFGGSSVAVRAVHLTVGESLGLLETPSLYLVVVFGAVGRSSSRNCTGR